jgi:hypothetical protein
MQPSLPLPWQAHAHKLARHLHGNEGSQQGCHEGNTKLCLALQRLQLRGPALDRLGKVQDIVAELHHACC